ADYRDSQRKAGVGSGRTEILEQLRTLEARDDLVNELDKEFDLEVLELAKTQVQLRVKPRDWKIFTALAFDGRKGAELAAELRLEVTAVLMVKSRVLKKLQEEVRR